MKKYVYPKIKFSHKEHECCMMNKMGKLQLNLSKFCVALFGTYVYIPVLERKKNVELSVPILAVHWVQTMVY